MDISWVSQGYLMGISWVSHGYLTGISWVSHGYLVGILWVSHRNFMGISRVSHGHSSIPEPFVHVFNKGSGKVRFSNLVSYVRLVHFWG